MAEMENNLLSEQLIYNGESETHTHLHLNSYNAEGVGETSSTTFGDIRESILRNKINWLQVHGLRNTETIRDICTFFDIDYLVIQDILNANHPTKIEIHDDYIVVILKIYNQIPREEDNDLDELDQQQICIIMGDNYVLTFMENESEFFDNVYRALRKDTLKIRSRQTDYLLSVLLNNVMGNYTTIITSIDDQLEDLEEELLTISNSRDIGILIQSLRSQYMTIKRSVLPLKEQYIKLIRGENPLMHKANRAFYNDVNDHLQFVFETMEICRETLSSLVDLYISNNDLRMNDIMKRLTIVSTIFIPLTFLVGIWGMNFQFMPELGWKHGYLCAWALMIIVAVLISVWLRRKKWY